MSLEFSLLSHLLLNIIDKEFQAEKPVIIEDLNALISKLEKYLVSKSPKVAAVANPLLTNALNTIENEVLLTKEIKQ
jgi:hypothetical protein